jgi:cupin fold WbuC family metalloprotein
MPSAMSNRDDIVRISETATRSTHRDVCIIDRGLVARKADDARKNSRRREVHAFHQSSDERLQRMLNALQPGTYIRPHRHLTKAEHLFLIQGKLGFLAFHDDGTIDSICSAILDIQNGNLGIDCRAGQWHTFVALAPDTVVLEVKAGPFVAATDKEAALWSPPENSGDGLLYLAKLTQFFTDSIGDGGTSDPAQAGWHG